MMVKGSHSAFFEKIPCLNEAQKKEFAEVALELSVIKAKDYPPQMQDLIIRWGVEGLIGTQVAIMVMDILYGNGTFRPLTEQEKVTSELILFSDILPEKGTIRENR